MTAQDPYLRGDGYPWLYNEVGKDPIENGEYQGNNLGLFEFPEIVSKCLWMWQGVFYRASKERADVISIPHTLTGLHEGMKLINVRTGVEYVIKTVHAQASQTLYGKQRVAGIPESRPMTHRWWVGSFHPDELTGGTVTIARSDGSGDIDLNQHKGDFLSLELDKLVRFRLDRTENPSSGEREGEDDPYSGDSGYSVKCRIARGGPNEGTERFGDFEGFKPRLFNYDQALFPCTDPSLLGQIKANWNDAYIDFHLHAPTPSEALRMQGWFDKFMYRYEQVLRRVGYASVTFVGHASENDGSLNVPDSGDAIKLRYNVRWQNIYPSLEVKFRDYDLEVTAQED